MEPVHIRFGGGAADTLLHPLVGLEMAIVMILILCLPRRRAIVPFLFAIFSIPLGQVVVLAGVHFTVLRILIITGLVRRVMSKQTTPAGAFGARVKSLDPPVTLWAVMSLMIFSLQWMDAQATVKSLGDFLDMLGGYFAIRFLIQDKADVRLAVRALAAVAVLMGICMTNEQVTHINIFGFLGGVSITPQVRDGKLRSQGAFGVFIDAGVFGAILVPLLVWLWSEVKSRVAAALGLAGATAMILTCNSSTPILAGAGGIVGLCFWPLRRQMRLFRRVVVLTLTALHLVMNGPVWALIARVDLTGASSGYHRYYLVDNLIRHFSDWWLLGYKDYNTWGWDMWDLSNQFVAVGLTGGLATLVAFIWILARSFSGIGTARKLVAVVDRKQEWFLWCLGSALIANVVGWFGCSYMAQMQMALFALLAMISVAIFDARRCTISESPSGKETTQDTPALLVDSSNNQHVSVF
jgi:hypothetical protein